MSAEGNGGEGTSHQHQHRTRVQPPPQQQQQQQQQQATVSDATVSRSLATKMYIEQHYASLASDMRERRERRTRLEAQMDATGMSPKDRTEMRRQLGQKETVFMRLKRQRISERNFEKIKVIGRGAFGEVWIVRKKDTGEVLALKKLKKADMLKKDQVAHVRAERDLLVAGNQSPWVVKLHFSFQDEKFLYLAMEFLGGGDMMTMLIKYDVFPEEWARFYIAETLLAIADVHKFGYIHRDIKPDNLLLDNEGHVKLTDFGLATGFHPMHSSAFYEELVAKARSLKLKQISAGSEGGGASAASGAPSTGSALDLKTKRAKQKRVLAYSTVGTPDYTAPEVFLQLGYGRECDLWSLGAIMFEMLIGYPPFISDTSTETCLKIINWAETLKFPEEPRISREARDLISRLICDRSQRFSSTEQIMQHPWFAGIIWDGFRERYKAPVVPNLSSPTDTCNFENYEPVLSDADDVDVPASPGGGTPTASDSEPEVRARASPGDSDRRSSDSSRHPPSPGVRTAAAAATTAAGAGAAPSPTTKPRSQSSVSDLPFIGYTFRGGFDGVVLDPSKGKGQQSRASRPSGRRTLEELFSSGGSQQQQQQRKPPASPPTTPPSTSPKHR